MKHTAVDAVPVAGHGLLPGVDRVTKEARAVTDLIGNTVATIAVAKRDDIFDRAQAEAPSQNRAAVAAEDVIPERKAGHALPRPVAVAHQPRS